MKWVVIYSKISLLFTFLTFIGYDIVTPKNMDLRNVGRLYEVADVALMLTVVNLIGLFGAGIYLLFKKKKILGILSIGVPVIFFSYFLHGLLTMV
jgi:hypothetical protein